MNHGDHSWLIDFLNSAINILKIKVSLNHSDQSNVTFWTLLSWIILNREIWIFSNSAVEMIRNWFYESFLARVDWFFLTLILIPQEVVGEKDFCSNTFPPVSPPGKEETEEKVKPIYCYCPIAGKPKLFTLSVNYFYEHISQILNLFLKQSYVYLIAIYILYT